ncbi:CU044_2847 family protein [Streptomyces sp. NPDC005070]
MADAKSGDGNARNEEKETGALVPVLIEGRKVYLSVRDLRTPQRALGSESDIAAHRPTLDEALDGLMGLVRVMGARLQESDASKVTMEFGCEFALESGTFVAVVGKASVKSAFGVSLEWENPPS